MKNLLYLSISVLMILVSCSTDPYGMPPGSPPDENFQTPDDIINDSDEENDVSNSNLNFGFLDADGSANSYIDMPVESSATNLFVGRWQIKKIGYDENNDGNVKYFDYENYEHKDCGQSFLQFNNDGVVFENSYFKDNNSCNLTVEIGNWELIEQNRLKIYVYTNIYIVGVTETELILKYDWNFENSLYGPVQLYYYFERIEIDE